MGWDRFCFKAAQAYAGQVLAQSLYHGNNRSRKERAHFQTKPTAGIPFAFGRGTLIQHTITGRLERTMEDAGWT